MSYLFKVNLAGVYRYGLGASAALESCMVNAKDLGRVIRRLVLI